MDTETDMHRGKKTWRHTGRRQSRDWTDASLSPRMQAAIKSQKGGAGPLPPWVLESMAQPTPWFPTASLQNCDNTSLLSFWYFVGVSGGREVGFIARHAWIRRGQPKALMRTGPALCPEDYGSACIWPPATGEEPLFGHHVSKFIHIKLWRSPLLGTFWHPGNLNLALRRASITCFLFCSLVQMDIMTWPTWTLATVPWGFPEAPHIPVWSLSAPGQDNTLLMRMMWRGGAALGCESHLCHTFSPLFVLVGTNTGSLHGFGRELLILIWPHVATERELIQFSLLPHHVKDASQHQGHLGRSETLGMACSYNTGNTGQGSGPWWHQDLQRRAKGRVTDFWCGPFLKSLFVTILLLFYVFGFWPWGMRDLSSWPGIKSPHTLH